MANRPTYQLVVSEGPNLLVYLSPLEFDGYPEFLISLYLNSRPPGSVNPRWRWMGRRWDVVG